MTKENSKTNANCCDGKLVKVQGNKLTSTGEKGDAKDFTVAKDATVTCDGKQVKLTDLKKGATIRMTTCKDDKNKVLAVDCGKHIPALSNA